MGTKYQYDVVEYRGAVDIANLDQRGAEGWEMVNIIQMGATRTCYLKRAIEAHTQTPEKRAEKPKRAKKPRAPRPPNPYQQFVSEQSKLGKTMKEIGALWKAQKA